MDIIIQSQIDNYSNYYYYYLLRIDPSQDGYPRGITNLCFKVAKQMKAKARTKIFMVHSRNSPESNDDSIPFSMVQILQECDNYFQTVARRK